MFRKSTLIAAVLMTGAAACNAEGTSEIEKPTQPVADVAAPEGGDWSTVVAKSSAGGYVMGNPDAPVKVMEYGSLTCGHCAQFEADAAEKLIDQYVESGRVSYEFRNYVRDPVDMVASLISRCGTEDQYFPLQKAMFASQQTWVTKGYEYLQNTPNVAQMDSADLFAALADTTGLKTFAAQRGIAPAKIDACLAEPGAADKLLAMNEVGNSDYNVTGTPTIVINGKTQPLEASQWSGLEPVLKRAVGDQ